jgi:hypothetical protein
MLGSSRAAAQLAASQEGLGSMEIVISSCARAGFFHLEDGRRKLVGEISIHFYHPIRRHKLQDIFIFSVLRTSKLSLLNYVECFSLLFFLKEMK